MFNIIIDYHVLERAGYWGGGGKESFGGTAVQCEPRRRKDQKGEGSGAILSQATTLRNQVLGMRLWGI